MKNNTSNTASNMVMVKKASGDEEPFSQNKLIESLQRAGADDEVIAQITADIQSWLFDGVTTKSIYTRAFTLLRSKTNSTASRYKLKNAIMELGNTGFPFEHLVSRIMETKGFSTETGVIVQGRCVTHEVDVIATKNHEQYLVECKYSQSPGKPVNVKVPLYVHSRVEDIIKKRESTPEFTGFEFTGGVATNTRFTSDSIDYGTCNNMYLLSWDYPKGNGIKDIIDRERIYPLTVLNNLTKAQKQLLMDKGIVICRQIKSNPDLLNQLNLTTRKKNSLIKEIDILCSYR